MAGRAKGLKESDLEAMSDEDRRNYLESESEDDEIEGTTSDEEEDEEDETDPQQPETEVEEEEQTQETESQERDDVPGGNAKGALKAKNAEIKALKAQLNEQAGKVDSLTQLVATFMAQGMTQKEAMEQVVENARDNATTEDSEPDFEDDPVAWAAWIKRQTKAEVEAVKKELDEYRNKAESAQATTALQQYEQEFAAANPDYFQVVNLNDPNNDLTAYYAKNPAVYAEHMGSENPVQAAYEFGVSRLIMQGRYKAPAKGSPPAPRTPAVVKGKQAPPSLAAVPSSREKIEDDLSGDLTEEQVAALSPKQRAKYLGGMS